MVAKGQVINGHYGLDLKLLNSNHFRMKEDERTTSYHIKLNFPFFPSLRLDSFISTLHRFH